MEKGQNLGHVFCGRKILHELQNLEMSMYFGIGRKLCLR